MARLSQRTSCSGRLATFGLLVLTGPRRPRCKSGQVAQLACGAQARVDQLLHPDIDRRRGHADALPFEWVPVVIALAITVVCHALL